MNAKNFHRWVVEKIHQGKASLNFPQLYALMIFKKKIVFSLVKTRKYVPL